jgi:hypothetical protein
MTPFSVPPNFTAAMSRQTLRFPPHTLLTPDIGAGVKDSHGQGM